MGRKKPDTSKIDSVLAIMREGNSLRSACKQVGIPVVTFLDNVPAEQYARAREASADRQFEEMADLEEQCRNGEIPPDVFRVTMDARKWRLARMRPRVYGDKVTQEITGAEGGPVQQSFTVEFVRPPATD